MSEPIIYCKFLNKDIDIGLCQDVFSVSAGLLKKEAVKELDEYSEDEISHFCNDCPYTD